MGVAHGEVAAPSAPQSADSQSKLVAGNDSAPIRLNPGRNAHDSASYLSAIRAGRKAMANWPAGPTPLAGALLPKKRIVAFYGNPLVKKMGVLGEYPVDEMLAKLDQTVGEWEKADPSTPVQPALHLIAVVAQGAPAATACIALAHGHGAHRKSLRLGAAQERAAVPRHSGRTQHGAAGASAIASVPLATERPPRHRSGVLDALRARGRRAGKKVGQTDAAEINYAVRTLAKLVTDKQLPPKVLVVHRWTRKMVTNASDIALDPHVQIVMDMDGWGPPWLKFDSYRDYEVVEPVQFTGFKMFFHHDLRKGDALLTPREAPATAAAPDVHPVPVASCAGFRRTLIAMLAAAPASLRGRANAAHDLVADRQRRVRLLDAALEPSRRGILERRPHHVRRRRRALVVAANASSTRPVHDVES